MRANAPASRLLVLLVLTVLSGCAGFTSTNRSLEPQHLQVATIAGSAVLRGLASFMEEEGFRVVCYGSRFPSGRAAEYQEVMITRLRAWAPVVLDARECDVQSGEWTTKEDGEPAIGFGVSTFTYQTTDIAVGRAGVGLPRGRGFSYEIRVMRLPGESWYVDDIYCNPGSMDFCVPIDPSLTGGGQSDSRAP